jgi:hypothetical protein
VFNAEEVAQVGRGEGKQKKTVNGAVAKAVLVLGEAEGTVEPRKDVGDRPARDGRFGEDRFVRFVLLRVKARWKGRTAFAAAAADATGKIQDAAASEQAIKSRTVDVEIAVGC